MSQCGVRSRVIVDDLEGGEGSEALAFAVVGSAGGPFTQKRLDHALGFPVGLRSIRTGAFQRDAVTVCDSVERAGAVVRAVVREDAFDADPELGEVDERPLEEGRGRDARLVGERLDVEVAGVVIDRDVYEVVAGAGVTVDMLRRCFEPAAAAVGNPP